MSVESIDTELNISACQHLYDITNELSKCLQDLDSVKAKIPGITSMEDVAMYGLQKLRNTADILFNNLEGVNAIKLLAKAYITIAYFAQNTENHLTEAFIASVLRSMKLGSLEGVQLFPCILNIDDLGTVYRELFVSEVRNTKKIYVESSFNIYCAKSKVNSHLYQQE